MTQFRDVTITKAANIYFDGKVTSRTIEFADGSKKTLGIMLPGEYEFNTADPELMEILSGNLEVQVAGSEQWQQVSPGQSFEVAAHSSFRLRVSVTTDYCCSFIN